MRHLIFPQEQLKDERITGSYRMTQHVLWNKRLLVNLSPLKKIYIYIYILHIYCVNIICMQY